jgi:hypothetical protein
MDVAGGLAHSVGVKEQDWAGLGEEVDQKGIPMVHCATEMLVEE